MALKSAHRKRGFIVLAFLFAQQVGESRFRYLVWSLDALRLGRGSDRPTIAICWSSGNTPCAQSRGPAIEQIGEYVEIDIAMCTSSIIRSRSLLNWAAA